MQFNTPYGMADDQSASYLCGLEEGLSIGAITGGVNSGSGAGGGGSEDLAIDVAGIVATYNPKKEESEISEMIYYRLGKLAPHLGGLQWVCTEESYYSFLGDFFSKAGFSFTTGYFKLKNTDGNEFGVFGAEVTFKSGIKMYTGIVDYTQTYIGSLIASSNLLWAENSITTIYSINGTEIYSRLADISDMGSNIINDPQHPTESYYDMLVSKLRSSGAPGCKTLHGDYAWADRSSIFIADCQSVTYLGIDAMHIGWYKPDGTGAVFTNKTVVAPCSGTETDAYCHLNAIINPNKFEDTTKYNVYKTFLDDDEEVKEAIVPIISLENRDQVFVLVDIINCKYYSCIKLLNNAFIVTGEIPNFEIPNNNALVASFIATEGGEL